RRHRKITRGFYVSPAANGTSSGGGDSGTRIVRPPAIDCEWRRCSTTPRSVSSEARCEIGVLAGKSQERGRK
ncbi:hypothetical protein PanWU01x14_158520, partial [Parasponia andersonii]